MSYCSLKSAGLILFMLFFFMPEVYSEEISVKGRDNYLEIKRVYDKWNSGLFGSRRLYRNRMYCLLTDMIGNDIVTGRDYRITIPDVFEKKYYSSGLYNQNWLHIHGPADDSSVKEFAEKGNDYIKEIERNGSMFFLSGRMEKFRIIENGYGRTVHLYLESVKITESIR